MREECAIHRDPGELACRANDRISATGNIS
jgi:hypothetical protein